jgi:hypothetical protein
VLLGHHAPEPRVTHAESTGRVLANDNLLEWDFVVRHDATGTQ